MKRYRRLLVLGLPFLMAGCSAFGTGRFGDKYAKERGVYMSQELALVERPTGATGGYVMPANSMSGDGFGSTSASVGSETSFFVDESLTSEQLTDFYLALAAKQNHQNILVYCNEPGSKDKGGLDMAVWNGKYGYVMGVDWRRKSRAEDPADVKPPPALPTDPFYVRIQMSSVKDMFPANDEDPINFCAQYPMERMAKVLYPYGLTPMFKPPNFAKFHDPLGYKMKQRKDPPHVTPRFTPTTTTSSPAVS